MEKEKALHFYKTKSYLMVLTLITLLAIAACGDPGVYDQSLKMPQNGWHKDSTALFVANVEDTIHPHSFFINLRHDNTYTYRNFYLFLNTRLPNGRLTRDTIEIILANKEGQWLGKGFGALRDYRYAVRDDLIFPMKGTYKFVIEQAMREEVLTGITDIGIRIE